MSRRQSFEFKGRRALIGAAAVFAALLLPTVARGEQVTVEVIEPTVVTPQVASRGPSSGQAPAPSPAPRPTSSPQSAPGPQPSASPQPTPSGGDRRELPDPREPPSLEQFGIDPEVGAWDRKCSDSCREKWVEFYNDWNWQLHDNITDVTPDVEKLSRQLVGIREDLQRMLERSKEERDRAAKNANPNAYAPTTNVDLEKIPIVGWLKKLLEALLAPN